MALIQAADQAALLFDRHRWLVEIVMRSSIHVPGVGFEVGFRGLARG